MHGTVGAHAQRLANRFLYRVGADGEDRDLSLPGLLLQLQRGLDSPAIEVVHVEFEARLVDRRAIRGDFEARFHVRYALHAHGNLHCQRPHVKRFT